MNDAKKNIFVVVLILAVMAYTIYNYVAGKTDTTMFVVCMAIMGFPLLNIINITIQQWRNKD